MSLREELETLRRGEAPPAFRALDSLAKKTVLKLPRGGPEPEDLRQLFLTDVLRGSGAARSVSSLDRLLAFDDRLLAGAVANRLRQLGLEEMQDYNAYRALSQHVARALVEPDTRPAGPPATLRGTTRFSYAAIKQAVDWLQAEHAREQRAAGLAGEPRRLSARSVLSQLRRRFPLFDAEIGQSQPPPRRAAGWSRPPAEDGPAVRRTSARPSTHVRRRLDARGLLDRLERDLPRPKLDAFRRRQRGDGYESIADGLGVALATAHAWVKDVERALAALVRDTKGSPRLSAGTVRVALRDAAARTSRGRRGGGGTPG
jgi:hypothetical protein